MTPAPQSQHPVQNRWIVYDNVEHEFSIYYDEQEARKEYEGRIKQINDDVGTNDEYEGEEEVYLASVIAKAEVVQVGVADDCDEGLYRLVSYDCSAKSSNKVEPIDMNSTDIMLLAHDEWKRREERKHNHPEEHWVPGFINGFLTDKKWGREYVKKLRAQAER
jgi:hypothetical protein